MRNTVFFIHPDSGLRGTARLALEEAGFEIQEAADVATLDVHPSRLPALVFAPWASLGEIHSWLKAGRNGGTKGPTGIIVLAPTSDIRVAIGSLDSGADDCLRIPFELEELVTRAQACLRRHQEVKELALHRLTAGPMVLDTAAHALLIASRPIELAPAEFRLIAFFLANQGRAFTREQLLRRVWNVNGGASERTVDVHVRRIRRALEPFRCDGMIQTVRKYGYRFAATPPVKRT
jgi:two-component system, OmpR family, phosphate regulon response regulator PhoB